MPFYLLVAGIGGHRRRRGVGEEGGVRGGGGGGRDEGGELEAEALHVQPPVLLHVLPLQLAPPAAAVRVPLPRGAGARAAPAALPPALHLDRSTGPQISPWLFSSLLLPGVKRAAFGWDLGGTSCNSTHGPRHGRGERQGGQDNRRRWLRGAAVLCLLPWVGAAGCSFIQGVGMGETERALSLADGPGSDRTEEGDEGRRPSRDDPRRPPVHGRAEGSAPRRSTPPNPRVRVPGCAFFVWGPRICFL